MPTLDDAEFQAFEKFRDYLLVVARTMAGLSYRGKIDAEDLVNQTLFDAFQRRKDLCGGSDGKRAAWLRQILSNNLRDAIRHLHRDRRDINREQSMTVAAWDQSSARFMELTGGLTSPSQRAVKNENELQLAAALSQLPASQREAIELHHLQGCTLAETAAALDRTVASTAGLLRRGLKRLREIFQETQSRSA